MMHRGGGQGGGVLAVLAAAVAACVGLVGCNGNKKDPPIEILPREALVARYNARAAAIGKLKAKCHIEARLPKFDREGRPIKGKYNTWSLDGNLLLRKPRDLYLVGRALSDPQFGFHSNSEMYWFWVKPGTPTEWFGRHGGPGAEGFAIRPDYLLQALGIYPVPADLWFFRRGDDLDVIASMGVDLLDDQPKGGRGQQIRVMPYLVQEVYLERVHHDPVEVRLYDAHGEPLVVSRLERYTEVDGQRVPTRLTYHFVAFDATFTLSLKATSLTADVRDGAFAYDKQRPSVEVRRDLDAEACAPGGGVPDTGK